MQNWRKANVLFRLSKKQFTKHIPNTYKSDLRALNNKYLFLLYTEGQVPWVTILTWKMLSCIYLVFFSIIKCYQFVLFWISVFGQQLDLKYQGASSMSVYKLMGSDLYVKYLLMFDKLYIFSTCIASILWPSRDITIIGWKQFLNDHSYFYGPAAISIWEISQNSYSLSKCFIYISWKN